jgi:glyoxylase I family protein
MPNQKISGCGFHHVALFARDYDQTIDFYLHVLGFKKLNEWAYLTGRAMFVDIGDGGMVEIFENPNAAAPQEGKWLHLGLKIGSTAAIDATIEKVRALGLTIIDEPYDVDIEGDLESIHIRIAFFKGYEGETFELFAYRK